MHGSRTSLRIKSITDRNGNSWIMGKGIFLYLHVNEVGTGIIVSTLVNICIRYTLI